jgi:hypothetical protein
MENKADILVTHLEGVNTVVKLIKGGDVVVNARKVSERNGPYDTFVLRTDFDGDHSADTDSKGKIYLENKVLPDGPGDYKIVVEFNGERFLSPIPIKIGPLLTGLKFSPNILRKKTFDPYSDKFDVEWDIIWPTDSGQWYGMEIWYKLKNDVIGEFKPSAATTSFFGIENDRDIPKKGQGDIVGIHYLRMSNDKMRKGSYDVKWEGFNDDFDSREPAGEAIDEIYKDGAEAEIKEGESFDGVGARSVCAEGKYNMRV